MNAIAKITATLPRIEVPEIGASLGGGFFVSVMRIDGKDFALVVAGIDGEISGKYTSDRTNIQGASSYIDGLSNTDAMAAAGSELAKKARDIRIGGFDDWFIPARDQLEPMYRFLKPTEAENYCPYRDGDNPHLLPAGMHYTEESPSQTTVKEFQEGGEHAFDESYYWSSTQYSSDLAFVQDFENGLQYYVVKTIERRARVARMIQLTD